MLDLLLFFVPQWSPFQPPLSLPSLAAWLRRAGYRTFCVDANILFYQWLFSDACASHLVSLAKAKKLAGASLERLVAIVGCCRDFRRDLERLRAASLLPRETDHRAYVAGHFLAINSFTTYLSAISEISDDFSITPYGFALKSACHFSSESLEAFADDPPPIIRHYLDWVLEEYEVPLRDRRAIGLSCIGEEQLPFTLAFGRTLKGRFPDTPILVGGTILPRIFERGVLKPDWFRRYFDVVVRNEGEKPCERMLQNLRQGLPVPENVPGIIWSDGGTLFASDPCPPLRPDEVPTPDFDTLPLDKYVCAEVTLPILASRGCYWGKCEFCHHFMVYGDRYAAYPAEGVVKVIEELVGKYGVRNFAFNDEAIPPKVVAGLGEMLPDCEQSGYSFTGLIKFEKYYQRAHFENLARVGFRSLYIGLESASERVLALMRKPNTRATIERNLRDASDSGVWTHCFLFFGFPGETEEDARETVDFVVGNSDIVGSFGAGVFVLEHNAPIQKHAERFELTILEGRRFSDISVYYDYSSTAGVSRERAGEWMDHLIAVANEVPNYRATTWIPREFLLCLISHMTSADLVRECLAIDAFRGVPPASTLSDLITVSPIAADQAYVINRASGKVASVRNATYGVFHGTVRAGSPASEWLSCELPFRDFIAPLTPAPKITQSSFPEVVASHAP